MPATSDDHPEGTLRTDYLGSAINVALAAVPVLILLFIARWLDAWARLGIPDPGPFIELTAGLGFSFLLASVLGDDLVIAINRAVLAVVAVAVVFGGALLGIILREYVVNEKITADYVAGGVVLFALPFIAYWLWRQLTGIPWRVPSLGSIGPAFVAAIVLSFMLTPFLVVDWNTYIKPIYPVLMLTEPKTHETLLSTLKDLAGVIDSLSGLLSAVLATAATAYIVTSVSPDLARIIDYLGLSRAQITAAQKLRKPLSDLIRETKPTDTVFKRDFVITPQSFGRESPFESTVAGGARIKLVIPRTGGTPHMFTFEVIKEFLDRAQIEIRDSLFFIYLDDPGMRTEPVCYGTGPEMWELMQPYSGDEDRPASGRFRGEFSASFFTALNAGNASVIQAVVENARAFALANNPLDDLLLTRYSLKDTMDVKDALKCMKKHRLRRALVVSTKTPIERAILGMPSIAAYLWDDPDERTPAD